MTRSLRVVLHAHSTWSYDGHWSLPQIARFFGRFGVDAVLMSEHDTGFAPDRFEAYREACAAASTPKCRLIPGIEYSSPDNDIHILTWGLSRFLAEHRPVLETLDRVRTDGGVAIFAHPIRRQAFAKFDDRFIPLLDGIELWNRKSDGIAPGQEARTLLARTCLAPTVGCDFHRLRHFWPLWHEVEVEGENLEAGIVTALKERRARPQMLFSNLSEGGRALETPMADRLEVWRGALRDLRKGRG